jgi:uncharacterized protein (DUF2267 family)
MEQLIAEITQRTGISDQQAREAVNTVLTFLKGRLPAPIAAQIDGLLGGQAGTGLPDKPRMRSAAWATCSRSSAVAQRRSTRRPPPRLTFPALSPAKHCQ